MNSVLAYLGMSLFCDHVWRITSLDMEFWIVFFQHLAWFILLPPGCHGFCRSSGCGFLTHNESFDCFQGFVCDDVLIFMIFDYDVSGCEIFESILLEFVELIICIYSFVIKIGNSLAIISSKKLYAFH